MEKGMIVAVTGQSGCGKSTLTGFFSLKGYTVIDCDEVAKQVHTIKDCQDKLAKAFGEDVVSNGIVNKKVLYEKAFAGPKALQELTDITHPFIIEEILKRANSAFSKGEKLVFVDGAVIIGHSFEQYCDKFIVVVTALSIQCARLEKRDGISFQQAKDRISRQLPYSQMLKKADYVINNNKTPSELIIQGEFILRQLLQF